MNDDIKKSLKLETKNTASFSYFWLQMVIFLILAIATVGYAGVFGTPIFLTHTLIVVGLLLQIPLYRAFKNYKEALPKYLVIPACFYCAFLVLVVVQSVSGLEVLKGQSPGTISIFTTFQALIHVFYYLFFFLIILVVLSKREAVQKIISFYTPVCLCVALLGIYHAMSGAQKIYIFNLQVVSKSFFATFPYENNYGAFVALSLPLIMGLACYRYSKEYQAWFATAQEGLGQFVFRLVKSGILLMFLSSAVLLVALCLSNARAATLLLMPLYLLILSGLIARHGKRAIILFIVLVCILAAAAITTPVLNELLRQYDIGNLYRSHLGKIGIMKLNLALFLERPWFGWGLGTYSLISAKYVVGGGSNLHSWYHQEHAANNYLEWFIETGAAGFALGILAIAVLLVIPLLKKRKSSSSFVSIMRFQAIVAIISLALLLLYDSHLATPAIALLFILQIGILVQTSNPFFYENRMFVQRENKSFFSFRSLLFSVIIIGISGSLFYASLNHYRAYWLSTLKEPASKNYENALAIEPDNHDLWYKKAFLTHKNLMIILRDQKDLSPSTMNRIRKLEKKLIRESVNAAELAPTHSIYWYYLSNFQYKLGLFKDSLRSLETAVFWSINNYPYQYRLLWRYLDQADHAASELKRREYHNRAINLYLKMKGERDLSKETRRSLRLPQEQFQRLKDFIETIDKHIQTGHQATELESRL